MTESTTPPASVEQETVSTVKETRTETTPVKQRHSGTVLGLIAIALVFALAGGLYYHGHQEAAIQRATLEQLQSEINALKATQSSEDQRLVTLHTSLNERANAAEQKISAQADTLNAQASRLDQLQQKMATIAASDAKTWLLSEAEFLVKMAARKLWIDQDIATTVNMLKSADKSLADINDPHLHNVRQAIIEDINAVASVSQVDFDGITLTLNTLSDQVMNLSLAVTDWDNTPLEKQNAGVSENIAEWRQNLKHSWNNFLAEFITIRPRNMPDNELTSPLLTPEQDTYLRENLRLKLLMAARAASRHQNELYHQSLESVSTWIRAYFDLDQPATKSFLNQLDALMQQSVHLALPDTLKSLPLVEKALQNRSHNALFSTSTAATPPAPSQED